MSIFVSDLSPTPTPESIDVNELTLGDGEENGYRYVDLGLSVKWATCNVGGRSPSDEGLLFQFGRVDGYKYEDENNQFRTNGQDKEVTGSDYIPLTTSGATYDKGATLGSEDDAAYINMEGAWRMPTCSYNQDTNKYEGEWPELLNNTTHDVVYVNGVKGMLFTSNKNGHHLFIPFIQGYWYNGSFHALGSSATVWSSQVQPSGANYAYNLYCNYDGDAFIGFELRTGAFSVRGVF